MSREIKALIGAIVYIGITGGVLWAMLTWPVLIWGLLAALVAFGVWCVYMAILEGGLPW